MPGVAEIKAEAPPYPQVSRDYRESNTVVVVGGVEVGGPEVVVIAGPCSVESAEQVMTIAEGVAAGGARILRGGAFKPRTSPYSFQGMGEEGLHLLAAARERTGLPVVTEVVATEDVEMVATHADMLQIGARNMQNFRLLSEAGAQSKPVLLKRGISSSIEEVLLAAEYVASAGNTRVILCERGIRTFETATRNTFDVSAVPVLKQKTHLPVIVDPEPCRRRPLAGPRTSAAAGSRQVPTVSSWRCTMTRTIALSDGPQSLTIPGFATMMGTLRAVAAAVGRNIR